MASVPTSAWSQVTQSVSFTFDLRDEGGTLRQTAFKTVPPRTMQQWSVGKLFGSGFIQPDPAGSVVVSGDRAVFGLHDGHRQQFAGSRLRDAAITFRRAGPTGPVGTSSQGRPSEGRVEGSPDFSGGSLRHRPVRPAQSERHPEGGPPRAPFSLMFNFWFDFQIAAALETQRRKERKEKPKK